MKHFVLKADANGTTEEIQVEQAIKDSVGNTISDTYAKKEDLYLELVFPSIEAGGVQLTLPSGTIDKIKNAKNVSICCKITDLDLTVTFNDHQYVIFSLEGQTADIISAYAVRETSESSNFHSIDIYQLSLIKLINGSEVQELAGIVETYTQIPNIPIPFSGDDGKILSINSNRNYEIVDIESLIGDTYAKQTGTYPSMTVGNASNATNAGHAETADSATNATNATNASLATSATNVIGQIAGKNISTIFEADGTTAKEATHAASADSATKATQDAAGNVITEKYVDLTTFNNALTTKANTSGYYTGLQVGKADSATAATKATQDGNGNVISSTYVKASDLLDSLYPVGSIYISYNSTSPASRFGGSWTQITDRFLLAQGTSYRTAGSTGGEADVTLTTSQIPSHTHTANHNHSISQRNHSYWIQHFTHSQNQPGDAFRDGGIFSYNNTNVNVSQTDWYNNTGAIGNGNSWGYRQITIKWTDPTSTNTAYVTTSSAGSGNSHNNMPPYMVVYMWRRTA